jgi:hypothetical protein
MHLSSKDPSLQKMLLLVWLTTWHSFYSIGLTGLFTDTQNCITRTELPNTTSATKAAHQPAYLRSFKLPVPKAAIAPKVTQALAELGVSHTRLVMPTRDTVAQLDSLLEATMALIEMKRIVDKVDYDIQVLKSQLGMKEEQEGDDAQGDTMDTDGGMAEGEAGEDSRSQSVASARSGRGSRRQVGQLLLFLLPRWLTSFPSPVGPCPYPPSIHQDRIQSGKNEVRSVAKIQGVACSLYSQCNSAHIRIYGKMVGRAKTSPTVTSGWASARSEP